MENLFEIDCSMELDPMDALIPSHEWSGDVEFSNNVERNFITFCALNGLVVEY